MVSSKRFLRSLPKCDENAPLGQVCEGMGKCGTSNRLNNCGLYDLYKLMPDVPCAPGDLKSVPTHQLPDECEVPRDVSFLRSLPNCRSTSPGELCEGDGECGTSNSLNNCGKFDLYRRVDDTDIDGTEEVSPGEIVKHPSYDQMCQDDAGPPWVDEEEAYGRGKRYHTDSKAIPLLKSDGTCPDPLQQACAMQSNPLTAFLEGPVQCGGKGWFCRIVPQEGHGKTGSRFPDLNFAHCNRTEDEAGDVDGHCHGSSEESTYYWWVRDHWHRNYAGRLRCCCDWGATLGVVSRCDYRAMIPEGMVDQCRDANEDHTGPGSGFSLGFEAGCPEYGVPVTEPPEDQCWEVLNFAPGDAEDSM